MRSMSASTSWSICGVRTRRSPLPKRCGGWYEGADGCCARTRRRSVPQLVRPCRAGGSRADRERAASADPIGTRPRTTRPGRSTSPATASPTSPSVVARTTAWVRTWLAPRWRRPSASCPAGSAMSGLTGSHRGERAPASAGQATCHSGSNPPGDRSATSHRGGTEFAAIDRHRGVVAVCGSRPMTTDMRTSVGHHPVGIRDGTYGPTAPGRRVASPRR
jgi:hypothetical protein